MTLVRAACRLLVVLSCTQAFPQATNWNVLQNQTRQFVREMGPGFDHAAAQVFVHQERSVAAIMEMLADPNESLSWGSAIRLLGYVSPHSDDLVNRLTAFLESSSGPFDCERRPDEETRADNGALAPEDGFARQNVFWALGYQLRQLPEGNVSDTVRAGATPVRSCKQSQPVDLLWYLESGVSPGIWSNRVKWISPSLYVNSAQRNLDFAARSIRALGISCRSDALEFLQRKRGHLQDPVLSDELEDALADCSLEQALRSLRIWMLLP